MPPNRIRIQDFLGLKNYCYRVNLEIQLILFRTYAAERWDAVIRCFTASAGQAALPTLSLGPEHVLLRAMNCATTNPSV